MKYNLRSKFRFNFYDIAVYVFLTLFAALCFYPLWYVFIVSITPYDTFIRQKLKLLPPLNPTFQYYRFILHAEQFVRAFFVSVTKTAAATLGAILITSMMAYGVSKHHIHGMKLLNVLMVFTMFFSGGLIPTFLLYRQIGLVGTFSAMVVPMFTPVGAFIIMRNYFSYSVPKELEEAGIIDGASELIVFFIIVIPISRSMIAAMTLFEMVSNWNDFYSFLIFVRKQALTPMIYLLRQMGERATSVYSLPDSADHALRSIKTAPYLLQMAAVICTMVPIMVVYPFLQKHFAKGILIGAVKG